MRTYCGINLATKDFYVGSTKQLSRRLKVHTNNKRLGDGPVFWLISDEHDDEDRGEEQFYLDFYWDKPGCLNLSPNSQMGNLPPLRAKKSPEVRKVLAQLKMGNTHGAGNKGNFFYYDPETHETRRYQEGKQPSHWKRGNAKLFKSGPTPDVAH